MYQQRPAVPSRLRRLRRPHGLQRGRPRHETCPVAGSSISQLSPACVHRGELLLRVDHPLLAAVGTNARPGQVGARERMLAGAFTFHHSAGTRTADRRLLRCVLRLTTPARRHLAPPVHAAGLGQCRFYQVQPSSAAVGRKGTCRGFPMGLVLHSARSRSSSSASSSTSSRMRPAQCPLDFGTRPCDAPAERDGARQYPGTRRRDHRGILRPRPANITSVRSPADGALAAASSGRPRTGTRPAWQPGRRPGARSDAAVKAGGGNASRTAPQRPRATTLPPTQDGISCWPKTGQSCAGTRAPDDRQ